MAFDWAKVGARVNRTVVHTFDHGAGNPDRQPRYQRRWRDENDGPSFPVPGVFDAGYQQVRPDADMGVSGVVPALDVHYGDFAPGRLPLAGDLVTVPTGPAAGVYIVVEVQANEDQTGALLILKRVANFP
ncbi:head-tail joining protein [Vineibacter terrae]|uniref:head-tail joining protein n=1 Tax=Vineibacter terrae TaxID=2586908 RepID=UPI002E321286|nr:hypothetical protein [Vineibacter terrae]HEX2888359.1 hypothetical protein [Vineibacter terrae]